MNFRLLTLLSISCVCFGQSATPSFTKAFLPFSILVNGDSTLTFTITAAAQANLTNIAFSDTFPAGIQVSATPTLSSTCPAPTAVNGATPGSTTIMVAISSLDAGATCRVSVRVTGTTSGNLVNTSSTLTADLSEGSTTANPATATLQVVAPPTITKAFGVPVLQVGNSTTLSFTLTNPAGNPTTFANLAFIDNLPAGLVVSTPNGLTGSCGGGTITANPGSGVISLSGNPMLAPGASCTFSVNVLGGSNGIWNNSTGPLTDAQEVTGVAATATITVDLPPTITKSFADSQLELLGPGDTTVLTLTITNPNATQLTGIAFTDMLPPGQVNPMVDKLIRQLRWESYSYAGNRLVGRGA